MRRIMLAAAAALALGACAPAARNAADNSPAQSRAMLVVDNENYRDVTVYLVGGSTRTRLGSVTSMTTQEFRIPQTLALGVSDLRVEAVPFGTGETFRSHYFRVDGPGQISLKVGQQMQLSTLRLYDRAN